MKLTNIFNTITYYILLLSSLTYVSWIIWARFFREIPDFLLIEYRFWFLLLLIYSLLLTIIIIKKHIYHRLSLDTYKKSPELLINYLDKYYIKNKMVTFGLGLFYLIFKISIVFYIRYMYLGYEVYITKISAETTKFAPLYIITLFSYFLLLIISIKLFYFLLQEIFFDELLKIYIYCFKNKILTFITHNIIIFQQRDIWGPFYLFFECIYRKTSLPNEYFYNEYYCYDYIYKYNFVVKMTSYLIFLSEKYKLVFWIITSCRKVCHLLYVHFNHENIFKIFPLFLLLVVLFYDFFNGAIYFSYYMLFFIYFIFLYNNFRNFILDCDGIFINALHNYFYKNSVEYSKQRVNQKDDLTRSINSKENNHLLFSLNSFTIIEYIHNNFKRETQYDFKIRIMNLRFFTMLILSLLLFYVTYLIINMKITSNYAYYLLIGFIILIWFLTIYFGKKTYTLTEEDPEKNDFPYYIYNKKYEMIFWLLILLQSYFLWMILFRPEILLLNNETLFKLPFDLLTITKIYTIDEKIYYLHQYFEYILKITNFTDQEYLSHILRQIDFRTLFIDNDDITLKDIQVYIHLFLDNYNALQVFQQICDMNYLDNLQKELNETRIKTSDFNLLDETLRALLYYITKS